MPRVNRGEDAGAVHHVIAQGNGRRRIVFDDADRQRVEIGLARVVRSHRWQVIAFCLMDTHLHLVLRTPEANLSVGMRQLLGPYARAFNLRHRSEGHLFTSPFYSVRLDESHLLTACLYVVLNPVRAGICPHPSEYPWCSYRVTAGLEPYGLTEPALLLVVLDLDARRAREKYVRLVDDAVADAHATRASGT